MIEDELKGLSPQERIRRLRELEEEHRKEIERAEVLISDSFREIEEERGFEPGKIAQLDAADIEQLLSDEEKELFRTSRMMMPGAAEEVAPATLEQAAAEEAETETAQRGEEERQAFHGYGEAVEQQRHLGEGYKSVSVRTGTEDARSAYRSTSVSTHIEDEPESGYESRTVTGKEYTDKKDKKE